MPELNNESYIIFGVIAFGVIAIITKQYQLGGICAAGLIGYLSKNPMS